MEFKSNLVKLPLRPKISYNKQFKTVPLVTNYFEVNLQKIKKINCYHFQLNPCIPPDERKKKISILDHVKSRIQEEIGLYVVSGWNLYGIKQISDKKDFQILIRTVNLSDISQYENYNLKIKKVKQINFSDIDSTMLSRKSLPLHFLNNIFKTFLKDLKYQQIGKSSKFFRKDGIDIKGTRLNLKSGFASNFSLLESGLLLRIDAVNKIIRNETVKDYIDSIYKSRFKLNRDEIRQIVRQNLINKTIITTYGIQKYYKIEQIQFGKDPSQIIIDQSSKKSLVQYYRQRYSLQIKYPKAPLLIAKQQIIKNKKDPLFIKKNICYLIAEFCCMTGIPQQCDEMLRKHISEYTIKPPTERIKRIQNIINEIHSTKSVFSPEYIEKEIGLNFSKKLKKIKGYKMQFPLLQLGQKKFIDKNKAVNFQLFDQPLYQTSLKLSYTIMYFKSTQQNIIDQIKNVFNNTSRNINLKIQGTQFNFGQFDKRRLQILFDNITLNRSKSKHHINLIVLPNQIKNQYSKIKTKCIQKDTLTSIILSSTLKKKSIKSILTKILLQMATKIGNILWVPKVPDKMKKTMLIGIDTSTDIKNKKTAVGFCSTINDQFSRFYSNVIYQDKTTVIVGRINAMMQQTLKAYYENNNQTLPQTIIILRQGCSQGQIKTILQVQINRLLSYFNQLEQGWNPYLIYISVDKKPNAKFYLENGKQYSNPLSGTLINKQVIAKYFDFYLIAQNVNRGCVTPTYYKVIYNSSLIEQERLQEFLYSQCFNYMNWTGSIRVPSVLQYATKISTFIGTYVNTEPSQKMGKYLFYI